MTEWPVRPLRALADVALGRQRAPQHDQGPNMVPYMRAANVGDGLLNLGDVKEMNFTLSEQTVFALRPGDVLVTEGSGSLATVGASAVWQGEIPGIVCFQNTLLRLRPRDGQVDPRFLAWWSRASFADGVYASIASGANIFHVSAERVRALPLHCPAVDEQRRIADFLDAETARIDGAIALISRQSEVLEQRYQATIDASIENTDSLIPLKYIASIVDTEHKTAPLVPGGGYWIAGTSSVRRGRIHHGSLYETDEESFREWTSRRRPRPGDVLFSREAPVGEVGLYRPEDPELAIGQRMVLLSPHREYVSSQYIAFTLLSSRTKRFIDDVTQGSLHPHLNMSDIGSIPIGKTSISEQRSTIMQLTSIINELEALNGLRQAQLSLLTERRQALITAAVTGAITV